MQTRIEGLKASDYARLKLTQDEISRLKEINRRSDVERVERSKSIVLEMQPILDDLRARGISVESVGQIDNKMDHYKESIDILVEHLQRSYSDRTRSAIARALAYPEARRVWSTLVVEYKKAGFEKGLVAPGDTKQLRLGLKDGLTVAIAETVTPQTLSELIDLVFDKRNGPSRLLLLAPLRKLRSRKDICKSRVGRIVNRLRA